MNPLDLRWQMVRDRWPVRVKNGAGATIPPFSIVLVSSTTTTNNEIVFTVVKPNAASTDFNWEGYLVTGPFEIGSGSSNEGLASTLAQPNFISTDYTSALGEICGPKHGQFTAAKYYYGYRIMGGATTFNGIKIAVARWVGVGSVKGKVDDTNVNALATCVVSVWDGNRAGDTTMNITGVVNPTSNLTGVNGKRCRVTNSGGTPELDFVEC